MVLVGVKDNLNRVLGIDILDNQDTEYKDKVDKLFGTAKSEKRTTYNPFLKKDGTLVNKYINYQQVLDNPNISEKAKQFIYAATGLSPTESYEEHSKSSGMDFNANLDVNGLASLDVTTELPKLSTKQISAIISEHFGKSTVIKPSDASGIYKAQQQTGMSALAILGIGALESGYGTSNIAKQKNNLWGWNATNSNPSGNATTFSPIAEGATQFAKNYINTYYNGYGAKTIYSAGTGNNPSKKGYAYYDNGTINQSWAKNVGSIMGKFYNTAKSYMSTISKSSGNGLVDVAKKYIGTPYVWGGDNSAEGGLDCSGFVYNALKDAGYNVGRTTANGYRSYGSSINKAEMQPGDLVFFGKNGQATHIGIYIGNGQMIHSSGGSKNTKSNPGKGVEVKNIDYRSDFLEARRY